MMLRRSVFSVLLVMLVACGPGVGDDSTGSNGGTAEGSTSSPSGTSPSGTSVATAADTSAADTSAGAMLPEGCTCRTPADDATTCDALATSDCVGEVLCPDIVGVCSRPNPDMYACGSEYVYDEANLACAIEALRDRTPGKLAIDAENDICGFEGCGSNRTEITIFADDLAVVRHCSSSPLSAESSSTAIDELAPPSYFDDCLGLGTGPERYACMRDGFATQADACG